MHELVLFGLIIMTILRLVGVGVSLEFYLNTKESKFRLICIGWIVSIIAGVLPILAGLVGPGFLADLLRTGNGICVTTGGLFILVGIYSYFRDLASSTFLALTLFLILAPLLLFFLASPTLSTTFSVFGAYIIALVLFFLPLTERSKIREMIGTGIRWYYILLLGFVSLVVLSVFQYSQGFSYGLYESENVIAIMINYFIGIGLVILMLNLVIHFEHSISATHKDKLKDEYSHKLGNLLQIITGLVYLMAHPEKSKAAETKNYEQLAEEKLAEAAELLKEIRRL